MEELENEPKVLSTGVENKKLCGSAALRETKWLEKEFASLERLRVGPPQTLFDVMIHPSAVAGEKGLRAFRILVERFFAGGGVALNVNIASPETLRDAQAHPERYENLQVRVAGWNIRWNDIPRKEQDDYIARIETVGA